MEGHTEGEGRVLQQEAQEALAHRRVHAEHQHARRHARRLEARHGVRAGEEVAALLQRRPAGLWQRLLCDGERGVEIGERQEELEVVQISGTKE